MVGTSSVFIIYLWQRAALLSCNLLQGLPPRLYLQKYMLIDNAEHVNVDIDFPF